MKWVNFHPPFSEPLFNHADAQTSNTSTRLWFYYIITKIHPPFLNPGSAPVFAKEMQGGGQTDVIGMDFSKAFNKVPHNGLLYKLFKCGIDDIALQW